MVRVCADDLLPYSDIIARTANHSPQKAKLRTAVVHDIPFAQTNKLRNSFLLYALHNYV